MDVRNIPALSALLRDDDAAIRWWGATGLLALRSAAAPAKSALQGALDDTSPDVRITAAEALAHLGDVGRALPVLEEALRTGNVFVRLGALNAALRLGPIARPLLPAIREAKIDAPDQQATAEYVGRMVDYLPARLGG
jgi:HEAT repeat protein